MASTDTTSTQHSNENNIKPNEVDKQAKVKAKQEATVAKKQAKLEAQAEKLRSNAIREGGKTAQDLEGLSTMGGITFFTVTLHNTSPDLVAMSLEAMNAEVDASSGERKGGAGHLGKFVTAANQEKLSICIHVPGPLLEKLTPEEWVSEVLNRAGKIDVIPYERLSDTLVVATVSNDPENNIYPEKIRDELVAHSAQLLRTKGLLPPEEDDDFVPDFEAVGLEDFSW